MQLLEVRLRGEKLSNYTGQWGVYTLYRVYTEESKGELARLESGRGKAQDGLVRVPGEATRGLLSVLESGGRCSSQPPDSRLENGLGAGVSLR